jgi:hypothetical protein
LQWEGGYLHLHNLQRSQAVREGLARRDPRAGTLWSVNFAPFAPWLLWTLVALAFSYFLVFLTFLLFSRVFTFRVLPPTGLCKMGSHGGNTSNLKTFAEGAVINLAKKVRPFLIGDDKSVDIKKWAAEGLAFLTLDADVKGQWHPLMPASVHRSPSQCHHVRSTMCVHSWPTRAILLDWIALFGSPYYGTGSPCYGTGSPYYGTESPCYGIGSP